MPATLRSRPTLADVVTASVVLDGDEKLRQSTVSERDRKIGLALPQSSDRTQTLLGWLDAIRDGDVSVNRLHGQVEKVSAWSGTLITLLGLIIGAGTALGVFFFDGSGRVNSIGVIAVLVLLPGLFLIFFIAAALPARFLAILPGGRAVTALAWGLSPGRLGSVVLRLFPADFRQTWESVVGQATRQQTLFKGIQKWVVLRWSQLFALGFQAAALTAAVCLVLFTDLAFGWSTTLTSGDPAHDAETVHSLTSTMAAPWSWAVESAAPGTPLIEESRYFRAAESRLTAEQAARLGAWWPFITLTLLVYGLLPRLVTSTVSRIRLDRACRVAAQSLPGFPGVQRRLHQAHVQTTSDEPETGRPNTSSGGSKNRELLTVEAAGAIINWSDVPITDEALRLAFGATPIHAAGGSSTVEQDRVLTDELANAVHPGTSIIILVKAWEPPLMELVDFLKALRSVLPERIGLVVVPVGVDTQAGLVGGSGPQIAIWRQKINAIGDPWLKVCPVSEILSP